MKRRYGLNDDDLVAMPRAPGVEQAFISRLLSKFLVISVSTSCAPLSQYAPYEET